MIRALLPLIITVAMALGLVGLVIWTMPHVLLVAVVVSLMALAVISTV